MRLADILTTESWVKLEQEIHKKSGIESYDHKCSQWKRRDR
jgi:hypothetical protein